MTKEGRGAEEQAARVAVTSHFNGNGSGPTYEPSALDRALKNVKSRAMRQVVLQEGKRADGRGITDVRSIRSRANLLPKTHGSCLFTRGETQARVQDVCQGVGLGRVRRQSRRLPLHISELYRCTIYKNSHRAKFYHEINCSLCTIKKPRTPNLNMCRWSAGALRDHVGYRSGCSAAGQHEGRERLIRALLPSGMT